MAEKTNPHVHGSSGQQCWCGYQPMGLFKERPKSNQGVFTR